MKGLVSLCMLTNDVCPFAWVLLYERRDFADYARENCPLSAYEAKANLWCRYAGELLR